jgi:hypothetical protein
MIRMSLHGRIKSRESSCFRNEVLSLVKVGMPRILLLFLNAAAFGFLIYSLIRIYQVEVPGNAKTIKLVGGFILLLLPVAMLANIIKPTPVYTLIYPFAIGAFLYLIRLRD